MKSKLHHLSIATALVLLTGLGAMAQRGDELDSTPPQGITPAEIIQRFAAKEKVFKQAREHYTWQQDVKVQTLEGDTVDGEYRSVVNIMFDEKGRRTEQVVFAPQSSLSRMFMTREDFDDIEKRMPFVLTSDEIPEYDIKYVGKEAVDELTTYVFDVSPKTIEKNKRYFDGRIWVDDRDFQIVKTYGKNVPDISKSKGDENLFPRFTTYREQIDGKFWFPTYTKVDDTLHFRDQDIHTRQIVKYTNYKQFGAQSKILYEGKEVQKGTDTNGNPPQNPKQ